MIEDWREAGGRGDEWKKIENPGQGTGNAEETMKRKKRKRKED